MNYTLSIGFLTLFVVALPLQAEEQLSVKGVHPGMTPQQVVAGFERHGIFPTDGGVGRSFASEQQYDDGGAKARVDYTPRGAGNDRPEQAESIDVLINTAGEEEDRRIYAELVEANGEPTRCSSPYFCTWTRQLDGWTETLTFTPARAAVIALRAEGTDSESFRKLAAAGSRAAPREPGAEVAPHGDFGPLTPIGVAVGTPMKEATAALEARGFVGRSATGNPCAFEQKDGPRGASVRFTTIGPGGYNKCEELGVVYTLAVNYGNKRGLQHSTEQIVAHLRQKMGDDGACDASRVRYRCEWKSPPKLPLAREVTLSIKPGAIAYSEYGFPDLDSRVEMPVAAVVPLEELPWWKQELARAEDTELSRDYSNDERFQKLAHEERRKLEGEIDTVYEYCESKSLVNALHDCNCVAQAFALERIKPPEPVEMNCREGDTQCMAIEQSMSEGRIRDRNSKHTIIKMADDVVEQCPDKAGAADYAYEQCKGTYGSQLSEGNDLETFCRCYAEEFAASYAKAPGAHTATLTRYTSSAIMSCTEKGLPSPLG